MNVCDLSSYVSPKLDDSLPVRDKGTIVPPTGDGLGVRPDDDKLGDALLIID